MATVTVRYPVNDVHASIDFYCRHLGFHEQMHPAPSFAMLLRGDLRLVLSAPSGRGGGGQSMPDGTPPSPGGWNRFSLEVSDLEVTVESLRSAGFGSATRSSTAWEGGRSSSRTHPETPSNCSSPRLVEIRLPRTDVDHRSFDAALMDAARDGHSTAHPEQLVERLRVLPDQRPERVAGERAQADGMPRRLGDGGLARGSRACAPAGETITGKARSTPRTLVGRSRCIARAAAAQLLAGPRRATRSGA